MNSFPFLLNTGMKLVLAATLLVVLALLLIATARQALAATIRPIATLSGPVMTAGDLFDGLSPEKAARVLGPAPQPGKDMTINARTLMQVALALDLPWQPASAADQVIVRRAATIVDESILTNALRDALETQGITGHYDISFSGSAPQITLPADQNAAAEIISFNFDPKKDSFQAVFAAPSREVKLSEAAVMGKIQRYVSVPVLKSLLRNGDVIGAHDIMWVDMNAQTIQNSTVLKEESLLGMTPRRMISAGVPVLDKDVEKPQIVSRGDFITIVYESGPIILTAKGKALQNGAAGDFIRIVNVASNRALEGVVSGDRQVTIMQ